MRDSHFRKISRRRFLRDGIRAGVCVPVAAALDVTRDYAAARQRRILPKPSMPLPGQTPFTPDDEALLDEIERNSFRFFWEQANPSTGLVRDRADVATEKQNALSSIAAVGFGLTAICIAEARGYIPHSQARDRVLNTLRFLWKKLPNHRGFFYHWANINTA
ncbi:MAG: hypothetical protein KGL02_12790, partial [Acidobacteriota bacterium]|nr:hypothetical protein [Acidobacteriota bacterium]